MLCRFERPHRSDTPGCEGWGGIPWFPWRVASHDTAAGIGGHGCSFVRYAPACGAFTRKRGSIFKPGQGAVPLVDRIGLATGAPARAVWPSPSRLLPLRRVSTASLARIERTLAISSRVSTPYCEMRDASSAISSVSSTVRRVASGSGGTATGVWIGDAGSSRRLGSAQSRAGHSQGLVASASLPRRSARGDTERAATGLTAPGRGQCEKAACRRYNPRTDQ